MCQLVEERVDALTLEARQWRLAVIAAAAVSARGRGGGLLIGKATVLAPWNSRIARSAGLGLGVEEVVSTAYARAALHFGALRVLIIVQIAVAAVGDGG